MSANASAAAEFWTHFQSTKSAIQTLLVDHSPKAADAIRTLDAELHEALIYLPAYDQKTYLKDIDELRHSLHTHKRSNFSFKSKTTHAQPKPNSPPRPPTNPSRSITNISHSLIRPESTNSDGEVTLHDIMKSVIDLRSTSSSVRAVNCTRITCSVVIIGDVHGSFTLRESANVLVVVAKAHQFRMENSQNIRVYLECDTMPIIEGSTGIGFVGVERVQDFSWLKRQMSPNWFIIQDKIVDWSWLDADDVLDKSVEFIP